MTQQRQSKFQKPSRYITIGSGNQRLDDSGYIKNISINIDPKQNSKGNKGTGYVFYAVPVDDSGDAQFDQAVQVTSFAVSPNDKDRFPTAPDYRAFFGVVE